VNHKLETSWSHLDDDAKDGVTSLTKRMQLAMIRLLTHLVVRSYRSKQPSSAVAIIVPASARTELFDEEEVSMRHLLRFLGSYDKYLITPPGESLRHEGFKIATFPSKFFGSVGGHNQLLMWPGFYRAFRNYEYILIYHLDSLVFSDEMMQWCRAGFDFIGAPWIPCADTPWVKKARVGNGGFALMKVDTALKVLSNRYRQEPASYWVDLMMRNRSALRPVFRILEWLKRFFPQARIINRPLEDLPKAERPDIHGRPNDYFWSFSAKRYVPEFKLASVEEGLRFAFEAAPRRCFELSGNRMPFGCHAWARYDRAFWEPYLLEGPDVRHESGKSLISKSR
jgi:hypothetical protein